MKQNYHIDPSRIFLAGRSMSGTLAAIMAAKYPDLFAAVHATLKNDTLTLRTQNAHALSVDLDQISRLIKFSKFDLQSGPLPDLSHP